MIVIVANGLIKFINYGLRLNANMPAHRELKNTLLTWSMGIDLTPGGREFLTDLIARDHSGWLAV